jgi:ABC-type proline/glycine betaine transport system permease subunit
MSSLTDEISDQVNAGRKTILRSIDEARDAVDAMEMSHVRLVVAAVAVAAAAVGVGVIVYRRRRRRTLAHRLHDALPESLRMHLKRPLERAAQAL